MPIAARYLICIALTPVFLWLGFRGCEMVAFRGTPFAHMGEHVQHLWEPDWFHAFHHKPEEFRPGKNHHPDRRDGHGYPPAVTE